MVSAIVIASGALIIAICTLCLTIAAIDQIKAMKKLTAALAKTAHDLSEKVESLKVEQIEQGNYLTRLTLKTGAQHRDIADLQKAVRRLNGWEE